MSIDIEHLRGWSGRTEEAQDIVTPRLAAEFHATFDPHLAAVGGGEAPWTLHWCLAPLIAPMKMLSPDGHPQRGGFLPPVPLPRRMWAGGLIEARSPLRVGDTVTRRSRIGDVSMKEGRTGVLCFVAVHHDYLTDRGLSLSERHDIVYRDAAPAGSSAQASGPEPAQAADKAWTVEADPVLLFRYSAMTFNGHRIHYDLPYVMGEEGYGGLVVHGPLQASLLFNLATDMGGGPPKRFDYRGLAPLTDSGPFRVCGARTGEGTIRFWTEGRDGRVRMQGDASF